MMERLRVFRVLTLLVCSGFATAAGAQDNDSFHSPTGNIHCSYFKGDGQPSLRCDVVKISNTPPRRPRDCDLEWGQAFEMFANSAKAARICHGDTVADQNTPILAYGQTWQRDGFTCLSQQSGMTCRNARGAGFELSRGAQKVF